MPETLNNSLAKKLNRHLGLNQIIACLITYPRWKFGHGISLWIRDRASELERAWLLFH